jgi:hypothetical protein
LGALPRFELGWRIGDGNVEEIEMVREMRGDRDIYRKMET